MVIFFFKDFIYLFEGEHTRERERERERERVRAHKHEQGGAAEGEGETDSHLAGSPMWDSIREPQDHTLS